MQGSAAATRDALNRGCANLLARAADRQVSPEAEVPYEDWRRAVVARIVARVGCSRLVVGPGIPCGILVGVLMSHLPLRFSALRPCRL